MNLVNINVDDDLTSASTQEVTGTTAAAISAFPFHIPLCFMQWEPALPENGDWEIPPICQGWMFYIWQVIDFESSMELQWGEQNVKVCLRRHMAAIDDDMLFLFPCKK